MLNLHFETTYDSTSLVVLNDPKNKYVLDDEYLL